MIVEEALRNVKNLFARLFDSAERHQEIVQRRLVATGLLGRDDIIELDT